MKKIWDWLKKWGGVVATALLALVGFGWLWRKKKLELGEVRDELAIAKATKSIAALRARRDEVAKQVGEKDEAVEEIDAEIDANKRAIVEAYENGQDLSDKEVEQAFKEAGY